MRITAIVAALLLASCDQIQDRLNWNPEPDAALEPDAGPDAVPDFFDHEAPHTPARAEVFAIGWYDQPGATGTPAAVAAQGINTLAPSLGGDPRELEAYVAAARAAAVRVALPMDPAAVRAGDSAAITGTVRRWKSESAISAWCLADDPIGGGVPPSTLAKLYKAIGAEDPRPVAVSFGPAATASDVTPYRDTMDVLMINHYPIRDGQAEFAVFSGTLFRTRLHAFATAALAPQGVWPVFQGYGDGQLGGRLPTAAEQRYMVLTAVQEGASGVLFWTHDRASSEWVEQVLTPLVHDVSDSIDALRGSLLPGRVTLAGRELQATLHRSAGGRYVLLVVHSDSVPVTSRITLAPDVAVSWAIVTSERRAIPIDKNGFADTFGPFSARLYELR